MAGHAGTWPGRPIRLLIMLLVAAAALTGCTRGGDRDRTQASIAVSPPAALVDPARLRAHRFTHQVTALRYPDAGHLVGGLTAWYGSVTDDALTSSGGTVAATQAAQADAHANLLALLASQ